jgi:hypothetical protein
LVRRVREAIESLRRFPERGRPGRVPGTRQLVVPRTPFVVPYRVARQEIRVPAVLHGACARRDWPWTACRLGSSSPSHASKALAVPEQKSYTLPANTRAAPAADAARAGKEVR